MKVNYDAKTDTLTVMFRDVPVAESDEDKPGVILDYDAAGNIVSTSCLLRYWTLHGAWKNPGLSAWPFRNHAIRRPPPPRP